MLRKLKLQVTQAVNSVNSSETRHEPLFSENDSSSEGFLCPVCMNSFSSPDELQIHFQVHAVQQVGEQKVTSSSSVMLLENGYDESDTVHLELDVKELKSQLQDEKRYSMELKKELNRLHGLIANQTGIFEDEIPYLTQQVQMLEAGKALATERILEMEKATSGLNRQIKHLQQEKMRLVKKIEELSTNIIGKTNEVEEKNKEKTLLGDELVRYRQEIQNLETEIENLQKKLDQRPSEDDVSVLRKELVHAQQLMDTITQEKEEEIKKDIDIIHTMEKNQKRLTLEIETQKSNIGALKNTIARFENGSKELLEEIDSFRKVWEEKLTNSVQRVFVACKKIDDLELIVRKCENKVFSNGTERNKLSELEDSKKSMLEVSKENAKYKEELRKNEHALEEAVKKAEKAEKQLINLQKEIVSLTTSIDETKQNCAEKETQAIKNEEMMTEYRKEIEQLKKNVVKLKTSLGEASAVEDSLKQDLKEAKSKESLLMQKISEGDGAEKLAMEQIHKEKMALEEAVNGLNETLKSLKASHESEIYECEECWKEKLDAEHEKMKKLGIELTKLNQNYVSAKNENKKLTEMLEETMQTIEEKNKIIEAERIELKLVCEKLSVMEEKTRQLNGELHEKEVAAGRCNEEYSKLEEAMRIVQLELNKVIIAREQLAERENNLTGNISELQKILSTCEEEKNVLKDQLETVLQQFSALGEDCSRYKDNEFKLLESLHQKELLIKEIELWKENISAKNAVEKEEREREIDELKAELRCARESVQALKCNRKELEEKINGLMANLEFEKRNYDESIKDLQCRLQELQQENTAVLAAKEREVATQLETISGLNEKVCEKDKQLSSMMEEVEKMHQKLCSKEKERCTLANEILKLNEENSELKKEMDYRGKCLIQLKNDFEEETNLLRNSLEKCKKDKEESLSKISVQLETEKSRLEEASQSIKEKDAHLKQMKSDLENVKKDLKELRIVQGEMEQRKTELLQEKRALQERYLAAESDLEFERERAVVNKRNFDDVQTAIRELGQVNQNLQMDFAKQVSRKWLEDSEARNCHACDKPFTLTNRKHHCRQCGQIFCASCSSFTAKIVSSRNPVRVCSACYEEIMHR